MSPAQKTALTTASHLHVAIEQSEQESLDAYFRLKALSADNGETLVSTLSSESIPSEYDYMTVLELVELIEIDAHQLMAFGLLMLNSAHQGLMDAAEKPGFEMDASRWSLMDFADSHLLAAA